MTDEAFILILKAKFKIYFENGKSVGMDVKAIVAKFRQEIEDDILKFKYKEKNENNPKDRP